MTRAIVRDLAHPMWGADCSLAVAMRFAFHVSYTSVRTLIAIVAVLALTPREWNARVSAQGCTYSVAPTTLNIPATGASGTIAVTASSSTCTWTVSSDASWATARVDYPAQIAADGAVGHWRFLEGAGTVARNSVSGPDGTLAGVAAFSSSGVSFDGVSSAVTIPHTAAFSSATLSFEAWVNIPSQNTTWQRAFGKGLGVERHEAGEQNSHHWQYKASQDHPNNNIKAGAEGHIAASGTSESGFLVSLGQILQSRKNRIDSDVSQQPCGSQCDTTCTYWNGHVNIKVSGAFIIPQCPQRAIFRRDQVVDSGTHEN